MSNDEVGREMSFHTANLKDRMSETTSSCLGTETFDKMVACLCRTARKMKSPIKFLHSRS